MRISVRYLLARECVPFESILKFANVLCGVFFFLSSAGPTSCTRTPNEYFISRDPASFRVNTNNNIHVCYGVTLRHDRRAVRLLTGPGSVRGPTRSTNSDNKTIRKASFARSVRSHRQCRGMFGSPRNRLNNEQFKRVRDEFSIRKSCCTVDDRTARTRHLFVRNSLPVSDNCD